MQNVYSMVPSYLGDEVYLRQVKASDAPALLATYSDEKAVYLFNLDGCEGDDFHYTSLSEMQQALGFWEEAYRKGKFVRWAVLVPSKGETIGTVEMFRRQGEDKWHGHGILRIDLRSDYENETILRDILDIVNEHFFELFDVEQILTKAGSAAETRIRALYAEGYAPVPEKVVEYDDYFVRERPPLSLRVVKGKGGRGRTIRSASSAGITAAGVGPAPEGEGEFAVQGSSEAAVQTLVTLLGTAAALKFVWDVTGFFRRRKRAKMVKNLKKQAQKGFGIEKPTIGERMKEKIDDMGEALQDKKEETVAGVQTAAADMRKGAQNALRQTSRILRSRGEDLQKFTAETGENLSIAIEDAQKQGKKMWKKSGKTRKALAKDAQQAYDALLERTEEAKEMLGKSAAQAQKDARPLAKRWMRRGKELQKDLGKESENFQSEARKTLTGTADFLGAVAGNVMSDLGDAADQGRDILDDFVRIAARRRSEAEKQLRRTGKEAQRGWQHTAKGIGHKVEGLRDTAQDISDETRFTAARLSKEMGKKGKTLQKDAGRTAKTLGKRVQDTQETLGDWGDEAMDRFHSTGKAFDKTVKGTQNILEDLGDTALGRIHKTGKALDRTVKGTQDAMNQGFAALRRQGLRTRKDTVETLLGAMGDAEKAADEIATPVVETLVKTSAGLRKWLRRKRRSL